MRGKRGRILSLVVSLSIILGLLLPAAAEGNPTFSAEWGEIYQEGDQRFADLTVKASQEFSAFGITATLEFGAGLEYDSYVADMGIKFDEEEQKDGRKFSWTSASTEATGGFSRLLSVKCRLIEGMSPDDYTVTVSGIGITFDTIDGPKKYDSLSSQLEIQEPGYTAGLRADSAETNVGKTVKIYVDVSHASDRTFAAGELELTYDSEKLKFKEAKCGTEPVSAAAKNGTLSLADYGADKSLGQGVYALTFEAILDGDAHVTLTSAAFVNQENAVKSDLISASVDRTPLSLSIGKPYHKVTLPEYFAGAEEALEGKAYTFTAKDAGCYDYTVSATVNGAPVTVTLDNGVYTIENVTGPLVIAGDRTPKSFSVDFAGNGAEDVSGEKSATYGTDYSFTLPAREGWSYSVTSVTVGTTAYSGYSVANGICTIPGSAVTGDIVITVDKVQTQFGVTVEGTGAGATDFNPKAEKGQPYTLTIQPEQGYIYTVTATMGVETVELTRQDNAYTVSNVTGDLVFKVESTLDMTGAGTTEFVQLNGQKMHLITFEPTLEDGKIPTYNGNPMLWSEKYNAYCCLVILESGEPDLTQFAAVTGEKLAVDYGMDVNKSGKVDASDAQLVYNIYMTDYSAFTDDFTVEKCLRADVNWDKKIDVADATAIVNRILNP